MDLHLSYLCFVLLMEKQVPSALTQGRDVSLISLPSYTYLRVGEIKDKHPGLTEHTDTSWRRSQRTTHIYFHVLETTIIHCLVKM